MSEYQKSAFNLGEQLAKLESQGLNISDKDRALHYLNNMSYFRFKAYQSLLSISDYPSIDESCVA